MAIGGIDNNVTSQIQRNFTNLITRNLKAATQELSTGLRINQAADDAAGLQNANRLIAQIEGINTAIDNSQSGIHLANTADQGLESITDLLGRIRELSIQAGNGTLDQDGLTSIQNEINQNIAEIDRIATSTSFGSNQLLNGDFSSTSESEGSSIQTGANPGDSISLNFGNVRAQSLGLGEDSTVEDIDITQANGVSRAIQIVDAAIGQVGGIRAEIGAGINRLTSTINSLSVTSENLASARSRIQDADIAKSVTEAATARLLQEANITLLTQTNQLNRNTVQDVLGT